MWATLHQITKYQFQNKDQWTKVKEIWPGHGPNLGELWFTVGASFIAHKLPFPTSIQDSGFVKLKLLFLMRVENGGVCPNKEGPTLKLSSQGKPMSRQNCFTLAHWSPFWDWRSWMCVASSSTLNCAWIYHIITISIESGDRAHELSCLFASCRQFHKLIICIPHKTNKIGYQFYFGFTYLEID